MEVRFRYLKDPAFVDGFFVKDTGRLEALAYLMLVALLVYALIERIVRLGLNEHGEILIGAWSEAHGTDGACSAGRPGADRGTAHPGTGWSQAAPLRSGSFPASGAGPSRHTTPGLRGNSARRGITKNGESSRSPAWHAPLYRPPALPATIGENLSASPPGDAECGLQTEI